MTHDLSEVRGHSGVAGSGQAGSVPRGSGGRSADGGGLFVLSEPDAAGRMAGAGDVLSWVLCAVVLLSVTGPVHSVRSGGFLKFLGGRRGGGHFSYHRGHSGHHGDTLVTMEDTPVIISVGLTGTLRRRSGSAPPASAASSQQRSVQLTAQKRTITAHHLPFPLAFFHAFV